MGFKYLPYDEAVRLYDPKKLADGYNNVEGEEYII